MITVYNLTVFLGMLYLGYYVLKSIIAIIAVIVVISLYFYMVNGFKVDDKSEINKRLRKEAKTLESGARRDMELFA